jgi:class 3 adenylate cyclase
LRIRVGVNSGGPIVAGVLGVGKPTFEILGPAINMAQQMEHHGVPMMVHVSRAVYELVYGEAFDIKERGATEINTGTVITYLVTPKPHE